MISPATEELLRTYVASACEMYSATFSKALLRSIAATAFAYGEGRTVTAEEADAMEIMIEVELAAKGAK